MKAFSNNESQKNNKKKKTDKYQKFTKFFYKKLSSPKKHLWKELTNSEIMAWFNKKLARFLDKHAKLRKRF